MKDGIGAELLVLKDLVRGESRGMRSDAPIGIPCTPGGDQ